MDTKLKKTSVRKKKTDEIEKCLDGARKIQIALRFKLKIIRSQEKQLAYRSSKCK